MMAHVVNNIVRHYFMLLDFISPNIEAILGIKIYKMKITLRYISKRKEEK